MHYHVRLPGSASGATHLPRRLCLELHQECVVSSPPIACPPFRVQSVELCFAGMETGGVRQQFAECYVDHGLLIDFHDSVIEYDDKSSLTTVFVM